MVDAIPANDAARERLSDEALRELMVRYQGADSDAAEQLVRRLSPILFRFLWGPSDSRASVEDLLQECWLRIHKARHTYRPSSPALPWIYAIARHTRLDGYRRNRRRRSHEVAMEEYPEKALAVEQKPEYSSGDWLRLLDELPESQREVILMSKVTGMSLEEIARATSSTVGAVKQRAHRAYETLRRLHMDRRDPINRFAPA